MIDFAIKVILCSGIVLGIYYWILGNEKIFRFNRFYLIFALIFSYIVPMVSVTLPRFFEQDSHLVIGNLTGLVQNTSTHPESHWTKSLAYVYAVVSLLMLMKLLFSVSGLIRMKGEKTEYQGMKLMLLDQKKSPFCFWNRIYIHKNEFENAEIDDRILYHEQQHLLQKHSLDLVFLELLKVISWWNPMLYFYKKAMQINHEFLADEEVLKKHLDVKQYQHLILNEIEHSQNIQLTHSFNFNTTKKRFIMMTRLKSKHSNLKQAAVIPVFAVLFFSFSNKIEAKSNDIQVKSIQQNLKPIVPVQVNEKPKLISETTKNKEKETLHNILPEESSATEIPSSATESLSENVEKQIQKTTPEFPGGNSEFRKAIANEFNTSVFKNIKGLVKAKIQFTVTKDGIAENFKVEGDNDIFNSEAMRAVKKINENVSWKPATEDGNPVNFEFSLPITMNFEN